MILWNILLTIGLALALCYRFAHDAYSDERMDELVSRQDRTDRRLERLEAMAAPPRDVDCFVPEAPKKGL